MNAKGTLARGKPSLLDADKSSSKSKFTNSKNMQSPDTETWRLTDFNSQSFCPPLLLTAQVYLADKPLLLKKKNQRKQHHRKRNFRSPFKLHSSGPIVALQVYLQQRAGLHPRAPCCACTLQPGFLSSAAPTEPAPPQELLPAENHHILLQRCCKPRFWISGQDLTAATGKTAHVSQQRRSGGKLKTPTTHHHD